MQKLIIVGAGGFGREVCAWARQCPDFRREWDIAGFLDDNPDALEGYDVGLPVLNAISSYKPRARDVFVCALGQPQVKRACLEPLLDKGARFIQLIHPSVLIGDRVELGEGVVLCPRVTLTSDIVIENYASFNLNSSAGHDVSVGAFSQVNSFCDLTGGVEVGREVLLGSHATVLPGTKIGDRSIVGAGSVVLRDVPDDTTVFGSPAKAVAS